MGKLAKIGLIIVVIIAVLIAGKNIIVKVAVENGVKAATGLPLKIGKLNIGILSTRVGITELNLFNPVGFPKETMFHAPEIYVDYDLGAMLKGKVHLEEMRLDFDKIVIVKNADGLTNLQAIKTPAKKEGEEKAPAEKKEGGKKGMPDIQIDKLALKVGSLVYKDYSGGGEPKVQEFRVNISENMSNVTNANTLLALITTKALMKTSLNKTLDIATGILKDPTEASKEAVDTLKSTVGTITDKIKLPFGGGQ